MLFVLIRYETKLRNNHFNNIIESRVSAYVYVPLVDLFLIFHFIPGHSHSLSSHDSCTCACKGACKVWNYHNTVDFIPNFYHKGDFYTKLRFSSLWRDLITKYQVKFTHIDIIVSPSKNCKIANTLISYAPPCMPHYPIMIYLASIN